MSERMRSAGKAIQEAMAAFERGELSDATVLGFRLTATALAMKNAHQPGALKIAKDYCEAVGIDPDLMEEQVAARMYEATQLEAMEKGLES